MVSLLLLFLLRGMLTVQRVIEWVWHPTLLARRERWAWRRRASLGALGYRGEFVCDIDEGCRGRIGLFAVIQLAGMVAYGRVRRHGRQRFAVGARMVVYRQCSENQCVCVCVCVLCMCVCCNEGERASEREWARGKERARETG